MAKKPAIVISNVVPDVENNVLLAAAAEMALPPSAELQPDGSVRVTLERPVKLRAANGDEQVFELVLRRLSGADMRVVFGAKDGTKALLARSAGLAPAKMALLYGKMDAADITAITETVAEMVQFGEDLPDRAVQRDDGTIELSLQFPVITDGSEPVTSLVFHRLSGADLDAMKRTMGVQTLLVLMQRSLCWRAKETSELFDEMDGVDIVAAQRVASFLSASGRRTGR